MELTKRSFGFGMTAAALLACASASAADGAKTFHYWVRVAQTQQSCDQEAQALGARFAQATQKQVTEAKCLGTVSMPADGKTYTLYSLDISYQANYNAYPYTAIFGKAGGFTIPGDSIGAYSKYEECVADQAAQSALFEAQTGLLAVGARCEPGSYPSQIEGVTYVLRIDGFGTPAARLQSTSFEFRGDVDAGMRAEIQAMLARNGAVIARTWGDNVLYYAKQKVSVQHDSIQLFQDGSQCTSQMAEVQAIYAAGGAKSAMVRCLTVSQYPELKDSLSLEVVHDSPGIILGDFGQSSPRYYSFAECMGDQARAIQDAVSKGRAQPLGGICHADIANPAQFILELYDRI